MSVENQIIQTVNTKLDEIKTLQSQSEKATGDSLKTINDRIDALVKEVDNKMKAYNEAFKVPGLTEEKKTFSIVKACHAALTGNWDTAGFEKEVSTTIAKSMNVDTGSQGGFFAPNMLMDLFEGLPVASRPVIEQLGITKISGLGAGEISFNKQLTGCSAYWGGSEEAATESTPTIGQVTLRPRYLRAWTTLSRELLKQTNFGVEAFLREELGTAMLTKLEQAVVYGLGTDSEPKGIVKFATRTKVLGDNGLKPSWDDLDDMIAELEALNTNIGNLAFLTSPQIAKVLRQKKIKVDSSDTTGIGSYYLQKKTNAGISEFLGYPFLTSTNIPVNLVKGNVSNCSYIIYGDWSKSMLASWGGMEIRVSEQAATPFKQNQVLVASFGTFDHTLRSDNSFCVCADAKIA